MVAFADCPPDIRVHAVFFSFDFDLAFGKLDKSVHANSIVKEIVILSRASCMH
jgi:hypothetical protein